jgi:hypothetical protein
MRKPQTTLALLLAFAPLVACDEGVTSPVTPDEPDVVIDASAEDVIADLTLDAYDPPGFDELAELIPGFAGYWFDRGCNLNVRLTDLSFADRVRELLEPVLRDKLASDPRCPDRARIHVRGAEFSWKQLKRWMVAMRPAGAIRGVTRMGISVPLNRLVFVVTGRPPAHEVIRLADRAGVPYAALKFMLDPSVSSDTGTRRTGGRG